MKPMEIYENTLTRENLLNQCSRSTREACQLKRHYTESTRSAVPPEWMFNYLRKHLPLWKSLQIHSKPCIFIEIYKSYDNIWKAIQINRDLPTSMRLMDIYENFQNLRKSVKPSSRTIREACQLKPHYNEKYTECAATRMNV